MYGDSVYDESYQAWLNFKKKKTNKQNKTEHMHFTLYFIPGTLFNTSNQSITLFPQLSTFDTVNLPKSYLTKSLLIILNP